ncbi:zinc finger protein 271-like [Maniola hyperantus]|uniref:zinc finger protein 271-like n=1 Tax=Aphantopus hyperantus TaxID=2795564 RepID=UPI003749262D
MINGTQLQLESDLHTEHPLEDKQTDLEGTIIVKTEGNDESMSVDDDMDMKNELIVVVKIETEETNDSMSVYEDREVKNKGDLAPYHDVLQVTFEYEGTLFQCTLCSEKFVHEHAYTQHMSMHLQNGDGDGECDASQVCKPHTAVSSSSSHSPLITENRPADPSPSAHAVMTLAVPLPASLATNNEMTEPSTEDADTDDSCRYKTLTDCFVKLYDMFSKNVVPRRDRSLTKIQKTVRSWSQNIASKDISYLATSQSGVLPTEYIEPVANEEKGTVSKAVYICDFCQKMFEQRKPLVKHIHTHTLLYRFTCKICQYKSKYKNNLARHMRTHTGGWYCCTLCQFKCNQNSDLVMHTITHTGEKPYSCKLCESKFVSNHNLMVHVRTHGEKPYCCKLCLYKCSRNSELVKHTRTHTGEKPYHCKLCKYKCRQSGDLVVHMRTHTGEKPYFCRFCKYQCTRNSSLVLHMRTHTGEQPYHCRFCKYKCKQSSHLVSHMRTYSRKEVLKMRCCVPFCNNTSDNVSTSHVDGKAISFHRFPSEAYLRAAWLGALGKQHSHLPDSAVVCSQHFLDDDIYETKSGVRQMSTGAIPSTVQVCMICLDTDSKLLLMSKHKLDEAYETLTGHPPCDLGNLQQTVCIQCAQRLMNFSRFKDKSLRARALMMELVDKHELITRRHIKMINRTKHQLESNMVLTTLGPDHWDLHIQEHLSDDIQTELDDTIIMKIEGNDEPMSVDDDMDMKNDDDSDIYDFVQDDMLKYEVSLFQCTLCSEEFVQEHAYTQHMSMHLQIGDGKCDTSQVCKPHTAVSCSSSHSSLITENRPADPSPSGHAATTLAIPRRGRPRKTQKVVRSRVSQNIASKDISYQATKDISYQATRQRRPRTKKDNAEKFTVYICDFCEQMFEQRRFLVEHIQIHNRFTCKICQYETNKKCNLVRHMRTHTGEKPYSCKICQYKCNQNSALVVHMKLHTGEKFYCCKFCGSRFVTKSHLVVHMRTHTGEKPYSCKLCPYKSNDGSNLVRHMRTHTGEKPFSCKLCPYKSNDSSNLLRHMRTHTGEKLFRCELCELKCQTAVV